MKNRAVAVKNAVGKFIGESECCRTLIESTNHMIWAVETNTYGLILYNHVFEKFYATQVGIEVRAGMKPKELFLPAEAEKWNGFYYRALQEGAFEAYYATEKEEYIFVLSFAPLVVKGKTIGVSVFADDITEKEKYRKDLEVSNEKLFHMLQKSINVMSKIVELRDPYTAGHQKRVQKLAGVIASELGLSQETVNHIEFAALVHDIGNMYIYSDILNKPDKLTDLEYKLIQTHVKYGYEIVKEMDFPWQVAHMIYQHHERLDGSGYPDGIRGAEISVESRILAVADVVEAMSSHRTYRPAFEFRLVIEELTKFRGVKYDGDVVDLCIKLFKEKGFVF